MFKNRWPSPVLSPFYFEQMQELSVDMGFASVSISLFSRIWCSQYQSMDPLTDGVDSIKHSLFLSTPIILIFLMPKKRSAIIFEKVYSLWGKKNTCWKQVRAFRLTKIFQRSLKNPCLKLPDIAMVHHLGEKFLGIFIQVLKELLPSKDYDRCDHLWKRVEKFRASIHPLPRSAKSRSGRQGNQRYNLR